MQQEPPALEAQSRDPQEVDAIVRRAATVAAHDLNNLLTITLPTGRGARILHDLIAQILTIEK
jgi:hypothetical protein